MVLGPLHRVRDHRAGFHDEGPVGGLGEQQLAGGLAKGAVAEMVGLGPVEPAGQFDHAEGCHVKVRVNPGVGALQPDRPMALVAPGGGAGGGDLVGVVPFEEFRGGDHCKGFLVVSGFAEKVIQKHRALVPPVAVQLGVIGADHDRFHAHHPAEMLDLFFAVEHEVAGVLGGAFPGHPWAIGLLVGGLAGDAVVLQPGEFPHAVGLDVGTDVVVFEVEAAIAVKVPVIPVAGIAFLGAPDLLA